jgi:hypothetical protein
VCIYIHLHTYIGALAQVVHMHTTIPELLDWLYEQLSSSFSFHWHPVSLMATLHEHIDAYVFICRYMLSRVCVTIGGIWIGE